MKIIPVVMICNEEIWIERIIAPLIKVFGNVIVADTGSTDTTREVLRRTSAHVLYYDNLLPPDVGKCRGWMQKEAREIYGATHAMLVDGDELYPTSYLEFIRDNPMPENAMGGFTYGIECTELDNGECWMLGLDGVLVGVSRHAIFSVGSKWNGVYPFESPDTFVAGHPTNYYWKSENPEHHFYHVHQMKRSNRDADVELRLQKKYQFSMRNAPEIQPLQFWLKAQEDYKDDRL